jgi:hypothetical protein
MGHCQTLERPNQVRSSSNSPHAKVTPACLLCAMKGSQRASCAYSADWHREFKNRAVGVRLDEPQFASVIFDHSKTDSEPQSCATRFCGKERIEYAPSIPDRNSGSGVLNRQQYGRMTVETRCEAQKSGSRAHGAHCLLKLCSDGHFVDLKIVLQQP